MKRLKKYFPVILMLSIVLGGIVGYAWGPKAVMLKPLGDIFLNLIFTAMVPLIFFSIASAVASVGDGRRLCKLMGNMISIFLIMSAIAAVFMLMVVKCFPPAEGAMISLPASYQMHAVSVADELVQIVTVSDFSQLLSHDHMLALILFAVLVGLSVVTVGERARPFTLFLQVGSDVFMKLTGFIMLYAPIGFFAYFAVLASGFGAVLLESYVRATMVYYSFALVYFIVFFSLFAYASNRQTGLAVFWKNMWTPMLTSLGTCSSAASIPANLQAAKDMNIPSSVYETVIPLGGIIHKDGSVLGAIIKISFLFGLFHMQFSGIGVLLTAVMVAMMVGTVMGAIPSGGMLGEMLILSLYGFPPQALMIIAAISIIIDPLATMLNVIGNTVGCMLVSRQVHGRDWSLENETSSVVSEAVEF